MSDDDDEQPDAETLRERWPSFSDALDDFDGPFAADAVTANQVRIHVDEFETITVVHDGDEYELVAGDNGLTVVAVDE